MMSEGIAVTTEPEEQQVSAGKTSWTRFLPIVVIVAGLGFGYAMGWHEFLSLEFLANSREMLKATVANNYLLSLVGFLVLYAMAVAFSFPAASVLTIFAGFLFGWLVGGIVVAFGATAGRHRHFPWRLAPRSAISSRTGSAARLRNLPKALKRMLSAICLS